MPQEKTIPTTLKYQYYEASVQNHSSDIEFINEQFEIFRKRKPVTFREDFGGTAAMACDWVKQSPEHRSWSIDLDPEPAGYGKENHYSRLTKSEKDRMQYIEGNVLDSYDFKSDIIVAFNFSYFIFKKRNELLQYFKNVRNSLVKDGAFFVDIFGGTESRDELVEETEFDDHSYFWDCDRYNPLTSECLYYIHFLDLKNKKKYSKVFTYDWRMWTVIEIRELMEEAGFTKTVAYWEGDDEEDETEGNGEFYQSEEEDNCESWVTYICGLA